MPSEESRHYRWTCCQCREVGRAFRSREEDCQCCAHVRCSDCQLIRVGKDGPIQDRVESRREGGGRVSEQKRVRPKTATASARTENEEELPRNRGQRSVTLQVPAVEGDDDIIKESESMLQPPETGPGSQQEEVDWAGGEESQKDSAPGHREDRKLIPKARQKRKAKAKKERHRMHDEGRFRRAVEEESERHRIEAEGLFGLSRMVLAMAVVFAIALVSVAFADLWRDVGRDVLELVRRGSVRDGVDDF